MAMALPSTSAAKARWEPQPLTAEHMSMSASASTIPNFADRQVIGRWGEQFVFEFLIRYLPSAKIRWVNAEEETGLPYDVTVDLSAGHRMFVEVKTSSAPTKPAFEVLLLFSQHCLALHMRRLSHYVSPPSLTPPTCRPFHVFHSTWLLILLLDCFMINLICNAQISMAELQYAAKMGPAYVIFRLTGVGSTNLKLAFLTDPVGSLEVGAMLLRLSDPNS